jgi:mannosyltransferase
VDLTFRGAEDARPEAGRDEATFAVPSSAPVAAPTVGWGWRGLVILVLAVAVVLRFVALSHLWLDEALSINIANLPLSEIPDALRSDGAPPLYYFILHGWMKVFGSGPVAVRALSGLFGVAALPLMWVAGRQLAGSRAAWTGTILLATSPFAVRYATEARMYSLVSLLVLAAFLAGSRLVEGGGRRHQVVLGLATGLALLTHYWSLFLVAVAAGLLAFVAWRGSDPVRSGARRALVALAAGSLLFLPWVPAFLHQLTHTGTPWGQAGRFRSVFDTVTDFAGGYGNPGVPLSLLYFGLAALGVFGWAVDRRRIVLELRPRPVGGWLAALAFGTLILAVIAGKITGSAFATRYAAVLFPLALLVVVLGTEAILDRRVHGAVLAVAVALGLWACSPHAFRERTSAAKVAQAIEADSSPGDLVVYCPDQLGPSVSRLLNGPGLVHLTFPRGSPPDFVNWVDYGRVNRAANPHEFAQALLAQAGGHDIWVVWAPGYRTYGLRCQRLMDWLDQARPGNRHLVNVSTKYFERPGLVRFRAGV